MRMSSKFVLYCEIVECTRVQCGAAQRRGAPPITYTCLCLRTYSTKDRPDILRFSSVRSQPLCYRSSEARLVTCQCYYSFPQLFPGDRRITTTDFTLISNRVPLKCRLSSFVRGMPVFLRKYVGWGDFTATSTMNKSGNNSRMFVPTCTSASPVHSFLMPVTRTTTGGPASRSTCEGVFACFFWTAGVVLSEAFRQTIAGGENGASLRRVRNTGVFQFRGKQAGDVLQETC